MKILVPSFGRAGKASTLDKVEGSHVVVPECQRADYERFYTGRVIAIPDHKDGRIAKKRNAVLDLVGEGELFWMLDDDLEKVIMLKNKSNLDVAEILSRHHSLMEDYKADFGGFSIYSDPIKYAEYCPFSLTKQSYGAVAVRNVGIRYDEDLRRHEDADFFLRMAHEKKRILRDNRYYFQFSCNKDVAKKVQAGGIEETEDQSRSSLGILKRRWGNMIKLDDRGRMKGINKARTGA